VNKVCSCMSIKFVVFAFEFILAGVFCFGAFSLLLL
jgi:hypothetical protein